jgi:hypothetical protein
MNAPTAAAAAPAAEDANLFAGLSFTAPRADDNALLVLSLPSVPTHRGNLLPPTVPTAPTTAVSVQTFLPPMTDLTTTTTLSDSTLCLPTAPTAPAAPITVSAKRKGDLKTLFPTEKLNSSGSHPLSASSTAAALLVHTAYPELPRIARSATSTVSAVVVNSHQHTNEDSRETDSLLRRAAPDTDTVATAPHALVHELLLENSRLAEEVSCLKLMVTQQQQQEQQRGQSQQQVAFPTVTRSQDLVTSTTPVRGIETL